MSISHDSASTIVCKEVFDENSQPSEKEVLDYARRLGIDPDTEPYLLDLAREGLMAALPKGWTPIFDDNSKSFYYYQHSTNITTWEHPMDAVYKDLVAQARASNRRRASVDEDTKTGGESTRASDIEQPQHSQQQQQQSTTFTTTTMTTTTSSGLPPPIPPNLKSPTTRIPMKLAPLKRHRSESSTGFSRRSETSLDRLTRAWKSGDSDPEPHSSSARSSLSSDRASRDYTNLRFQDPEFYESPKIIDARNKKKLDLRDVLKRSESLSPRHEKDWKQLSSRFSSEENIIDIDNLNVTSLGAKPRTPESHVETPATDSSLHQQQQHQHQPQQQQQQHQQQQQQQQQPKELTLSGGGSIFLKSNRSRDATPCHDETRLEDFQTAGISLNVTGGSVEDMSASAGERLKSILREKANEDDDRPVDEERKSVRFDLEKVDIQTAVTKFNDSGSDDEESEENVPEKITGEISAIIAARRVAAVLSLQKILNRQGGADFENNSFFVKKVDIEPKKPKIVGRRFVVENVSEKEHMQQQEDRSIDNDEEYIPSKFENIKNIDLVSRSDSEKTTPRSSGDSRSSFLEDLRKSKEKMLENMRKSEIRAKKNEESDKSSNQSEWSTKMLRTLELSKEGNKALSTDNIALNFEVTKANMIKEHEQELRKLKLDLDAKLEETKKYLESEFNEQKLSLEASMQERLAELKKEMTEKEEQEIQKLIADMDEARVENLKKVRSELEICYEKERQDMLTNLKSELDQRKRELLELRSQELSKLETEYERGLDDEKQVKICEMEIVKQHNERIENLKKELDKEFDTLRADLRTQQREKITKITEDHEKCLADILRDFRIDEGLARKVYKQRLDEIRADYSKDVENEIKKQNGSAVRQESVDYEKIRCEKRLLEDKYNTLKEKYLKLKKDMRVAIEKRNRHRQEQANTTASETEMSTSTRTRTDRTESSDQKSPLTKTNSISNSKPKEISSQNPNALKDPQHQQQLQPDYQQQRVVTSAAAGAQPANQSNAAAQAQAALKSQKFESDDTTTCSETTSHLLMISKKKCFTKKQPSSGANKLNNNLADNPVENIRKQLEKLEDLGDQLPSNETAYTVRYPFQDKSPTNVSSELEFFRHRIHVERDSVKRAREALRQQRSVFQSRQKAWKQRSARATLEQLVKEERELSDMEVSLHRTRSLLGEKVIHLRHLEQSLERVASAKRNENEQPTAPIAAATAKSDEVTLSDVSSASSGFSSTDLGTDTFIDKYCHYQESTEIIASLENLNSEIREIWGVLNKRQDNTVPPPPTLMYTDLSWFPYQHLTTQPATVPAAFGTPNIQSNILSQLTAAHPPGATQNIIAQYGPTSGFTTSVGTVEGAVASNLMERTRNLKDWLRQARAETSDLVSPGQATL